MRYLGPLSSAFIITGRMFRSWQRRVYSLAVTRRDPSSAIIRPEKRMKRGRRSVIASMRSVRSPMGRSRHVFCGKRATISKPNDAPLSVSKTSVAPHTLSVAVKVCRSVVHASGRVSRSGSASMRPARESRSEMVSDRPTVPCR